MKITTNKGKKENLDELFQETLDFIRKNDPSLLEDVYRAASEDCRDMDFILAVAVRINIIAFDLGFSEEIRFYLKKIQIGLLYKGSELHPKGIAPYLTETSVYSEEA